MGRQVYGVTTLEVGLNNQRMVLLGLIGMAYLEGAKVTLPRRLVDFTPVRWKDRPAEAPTIAFGEVFDVERLREGLAPYDILTDDPATEELSAVECFHRGGSFSLLSFDDAPDRRGYTYERTANSRSAAAVD